MTSASDIVSAVFGVVSGGLVIWLIVRIINDRRQSKVAYAAIVVGACLWLPFCWLLLTGGPWDSVRLTWLRMWPILPGFVPGAMYFHRYEALEFSTMAVTTLVLLMELIWLASRGRKSLIAAAVIALLISVPTACITYALYRA